MGWDDFKDDASEQFWETASDWFAASLPKPPGQQEQPAAPAQPAVVFQSLPAQIGGVDQKTILIAGGVLVVSLALFLVLSKKGRK